jgi:hypothetical protein
MLGDGILGASKPDTPTDVAPEIPLLRRRLCSEPEEVYVASGVVAMRRSGVAGRSVYAGRMPTLRCALISNDAQHHLTVDLRLGFAFPCSGDLL